MFLFFFCVDDGWMDGIALHCGGAHTHSFLFFHFAFLSFLIPFSNASNACKRMISHTFSHPMCAVQMRNAFMLVKCWIFFECFIFVTVFIRLF